MTLNRRRFLMSAAAAAVPAALRSQQRQPNIVMIYADDLGYGDLSCYGSPIATPNLDRMAEEGARFTNFYSASPVCSPSRAALLTGRYPTRVEVPVVLSPGEAGLPDSETTLAQVLKAAGYRTACIGKWHLGSPARFLPTNRGFDEFFGVPYSADMTPCPLIRDTTVMAPSVDVSTLTTRFTQEALDFVNRSKESPFFLYLAHTAPHLPLAASARFAGKSGLGEYARRRTGARLEHRPGDGRTSVEWTRLQHACHVLQRQWTLVAGQSGKASRPQRRDVRGWHARTLHCSLSRASFLPVSAARDSPPRSICCPPSRVCAAPFRHPIRSMEWISGLCSPENVVRSSAMCSSTSIACICSARALDVGSCTWRATTRRPGRRCRLAAG